MDLGRRSFIKGASMVAVSVPAVAAASVAPASTTLHETDVLVAGGGGALREDGYDAALARREGPSEDAQGSRRVFGMSAV